MHAQLMHCWNCQGLRGSLRQVGNGRVCLGGGSVCYRQRECIQPYNLPVERGSQSTGAVCLGGGVYKWREFWLGRRLLRARSANALLQLPRAEGVIEARGRRQGSRFQRHRDMLKSKGCFW